MSLLIGLTTFTSSVILTPFLFFILCIIFTASIGKSFGARRLYTSLLLKIFEYGRVNIEKSKRKNSHGTVNDDTPEEVDSTTNDKNTNIPNGLNGVIANGNGNSVISRGVILSAPDLIKSTSKETKEMGDEEAKTVDFKLSNCLEYIKAGMEAIIEDDVTSRFEAEELKNWNLLTRTNRAYEFISWRLTVIWVFGFFVRWVVLMPIRVFICFCGIILLTLCTTLLGLVPDNAVKRWFLGYIYMLIFNFLSSALSSVITYHNTDNRPSSAGICVANHTSPIDVLMLMCDNCYSLIGQRHGGFLGVIQNALIKTSPHIWFERAEAKDRETVARRLREHVSNPNNPPILIFPEGTCINNTSVMQFKKGSFEVGGVIYPVAIKYDARFGDPFWNSSRYSMMQYLFLMMTSWAIVCDVWYLPPMYRGENEPSIDFANRVKSVIAKQGGLVDLQWDGALKRNNAKKEWKELQQEEFTKRLKGE